MPTYDYRCEKCGHEFEENLKIADRKIPTEELCEEQILQNENSVGHGFEKCGGEVKQIIVAASGLADPVRLGIRKPDDGFKDMMKRMKKNVHGAQNMDLNF